MFTWLALALKWVTLSAATSSSVSLLFAFPFPFPNPAFFLSFSLPGFFTKLLFWFLRFISYFTFHFTLLFWVSGRAWCCGNSLNTERMDMEKHDLSDVTVVGDPQLLQKKVSTIRMAGPARLQVIFVFFHIPYPIFYLFKSVLSCCIHILE